MASHEENLAYVAEHDPARVLQAYRQRKAATPQQKVDASVKRGRQSDSSTKKLRKSTAVFFLCLFVQAPLYLTLWTLQADQKAMANSKARAAKVRKCRPVYYRSPGELCI